MQRTFRAIVVLGLMITPAAAGESVPAVIVRARSADALLDQGRVLFDQVGLAKTADQLETLLKGKAGPKGLDGMDRTRPLGIVVHFNPDPTGALLVPIPTEKGFLDLLDRLELKSVKEADGTYNLKPGSPLPIYVKFDQQYAWIAPLSKQIFGAKFDVARTFAKAGPLLSARVRIDLIPNDARQLAIAHFEDSLQQAMKKSPPATKTGQKEFTAAVNQVAARFFAQFLQEGKELIVDFDLDSTQKLIKAQLRFDPVAGSDLAKSLEKAEKRASVFPAQAPPGTALYARLNLVLPEPLAKSLTLIFEESVKEAEENLQDPGKKKQAQEFLGLLRPTLQAGTIDTVFHLVGPSADHKLGVLLAAKVLGGDKLGATFRTLAEEVRKQMPELDQGKVILDAASVGAVKIHRFQLPSDKNKGAADLLEDPTLSVAFRSDAVLVGLGVGSLDAVKRLVEAKSGSAATSLALLDIDVARLAPLLAPTPQLRATVRTIFLQPDDGRIRVRAEGGASLRIEMSVATPVLQFLGQTRKVEAKVKSD